MTPQQRWHHLPAHVPVRRDPDGRTPASGSTAVGANRSPPYPDDLPVHPARGGAGWIVALVVATVAVTGALILGTRSGDSAPAGHTCAHLCPAP